MLARIIHSKSIHHAFEEAIRLRVIHSFRLMGVFSFLGLDVIY